MTLSTTVREHTRQKPYAKQREAMTARLLAEIEAHVDRQITASLKTFRLNVLRAAKAGRL